MRVTLINYTVDAAHTLIFTKGTRLGLNRGRVEGVQLLGEEVVDNELAYIANTIPSSWEFVDYTFLIEDVSRAFTHQFVRNRHGSYAQESLRVTDKCDFGFVMPDRIAAHAGAHDLVAEWLRDTKHLYSVLVDALDIPAEDARSILPTNIATNIVAKFNLRTLSDLAKSRLGGRTQSEHQKVMQLMITEVLTVHPWAKQFIYGDRDPDYFQEIEAFALKEFPDLVQRGKLLKIVDKMRKQS